MTERYTMDAQDYYDGDRPLRDTDIRDRLNEQDDDLDRLRADNAVLREAIASFLAANTYSTIGSRRAKLRQLVSTDHPGAQLLDELAAAQRWAKLWKRKAKGHRVNFRNTIRMWSALLIKKVRQDEEIAAARKIIAALRQHWNAGGEVWGSIDGDFAAYDAAVKECER